MRRSRAHGAEEGMVLDLALAVSQAANAVITRSSTGRVSVIVEPGDGCLLRARDRRRPRPDAW
ncbi:MAG: hypothetical protein M3O90_04600 [Actinomycetota bacterium]|nr:hypothetical protein [Actinomycetota bacterium]